MGTEAVGLPPGVLTIYEQTGAGVAYVGDARLAPFPAGEKRLVSYAVDEARDADFSVWIKSAGEPLGRRNFDLVFTAGLLIHVSPDALKSVMGNIVDASRQYVLAVEYADDTEVEVPYRSHSEKLWRRPYGKLYEDMGLSIVDTGLLTKDQGFDSCTYWLLAKE